MWNRRHTRLRQPDRLSAEKHDHAVAREAPVQLADELLVLAAVTEKHAVWTVRHWPLLLAPACRNAGLRGGEAGKTARLAADTLQAPVSNCSTRDYRSPPVQN